jgi:hypothetical protein
MCVLIAWNAMVELFLLGCFTIIYAFVFGVIDEKRNCLTKHVLIKQFSAGSQTKL